MNTNFPETLRMLRHDRRLSQVELAKKLGVGKSTVSQWETGECEPTLSNLVAISKFFEVPLDELVGSDN